MNESSRCSTSSPAFGVVSVLDFRHSHRWVVVSKLHFKKSFPAIHMQMAQSFEKYGIYRKRSPYHLLVLSFMKATRADTQLENPLV